MKEKIEWLDRYFNVTPDIVYFIDMEGCLQFWNAALAKLCGLSADKMKGRACIEFVCDEDKPVVMADVQKVFANGSHANIYHFIRYDGVLIPYHCNGNVTFNEDGVPDGFIGLGRDISESTRAEDALREIQQNYQSIFQNSPIGIFRALPEGRFLTVNPAFAFMLGYASPNELIEHFTDIKTQLYVDQNKHNEVITAILPDAEWQHTEAAFFRKDGTTINVSIKSHNVLNANGTTAYREGFVDDITERKQSEIALLESEEKYRGLFENAGDLAYGTDLKGNFTALSASLLKVTGYYRSELINAPISTILTPDNLALARQMTSAKLDENMPVTRYELEITDKTGKQIPLELVSTLTYKSGVPIGVQGIGRDITERRALERELVRQATVDLLTGLSNRRQFLELAEQELARTRRYNKLLSVLMLDLDNFKSINDTFGHQFGDNVLVKVGEICRKTLREVDIVGRIGGEEFAILLPESDTKQAIEVAERLRLDIANAVIPLDRGINFNFTASIGIATLTATETTIDKLLNLADKALYEAKHKGRNTVCATHE